MAQWTCGVAPRVHFNTFKLPGVAQLSESAVKPFGSFPQAKLFGSQVSPDPLRQRSELFLTIRDPEVVGKASDNQIQVGYDLLQIDRGVSPGDSFHLVLELANFLSLDPRVAGVDRYSEIVNALKAMDDMALLFVDG